MSRWIKDFLCFCAFVFKWVARPSTVKKGQLFDCLLFFSGDVILDILLFGEFIPELI